MRNKNTLCRTWYVSNCCSLYRCRDIKPQIAKSKMAAAAILKITLLAISWPFLHIFAPNLIQRLKTWVLQRDLPSKFTQVKNPRRQWLPSWNQLNGCNSAIFEWICTKFNTGSENVVPQLVLLAKLISLKFQDGGGCHISNHTFGRKSAIFAYICTEFDTEAENCLLYTSPSPRD